MELALLGGLASLGYIAGKDKTPNAGIVQKNEFPTHQLHIPDQNVYSHQAMPYAENETRRRASQLSQEAQNADKVIDHDHRYRLARMRGESDQQLASRMSGEQAGLVGPVVIDQNAYPKIGNSFQNFALNDQAFSQKVQQETKQVEEQIRNQTAMTQKGPIHIQVEKNTQMNPNYSMEQFTSLPEAADFNTFGDPSDYDKVWQQSTIMNGVTNRYHHETHGSMMDNQDPSKGLLPGSNHFANGMYGEVGQVAQRPTSEGKDRKRDATFTHNNMVPYFGGTSKQNINPTAHETRLHNMTGNFDYTTKSKSEVPHLFEPQQDIGNVYGSTSFNDRREEMLDEIKKSVSIYRQGERPIEQQKVAPGLNLGAGVEGRGGFHDMTRILPKETNEERVNPKISYQSRVTSGKTLTEEGTSRPRVDKNRPEKYYTNLDGSRNFVTTSGDETRPRVAPKVVLKNTNRINSHEIKGNVYNPSNQQKSMKRGEYTESLRENYELNRSGPAVAIEASVGNEIAKNDGYQARDTKRTDTQFNTFNGLLTQLMGGIRSALLDEARPTAKELNEENTQQGRNVGSSNQGVSYTRQDSQEARGSLKELTEVNTHIALNPKLAEGGRTFTRDPVNKAKITLKNLTETNTQNGRGIGGTDGSQNIYIRDPENEAKSTIKETTQVNPNQQGYISNSIMQNADGYKVRGVEPRYTPRNETSDHEFIPSAGSAGVSKSTVYDGAYNADLNAVKEIVAKGRTQMGSSTKLMNGMDTIHVDVHRIEETKKNRNDLIQENPNNDVVINSSIDPSSTLRGVITKDKNTTDEGYSGTRIYPEILNAFKKNPYAQSLHSYY